MFRVGRVCRVDPGFTADLKGTKMSRIAILCATVGAT